MGLASRFWLLSGVQTVKDEVVTLAPEVSILMPISSLFLRVLEGAVQLNISHSSHLFVGLLLVVEGEVFGQLNHRVPNSFGEVDHLLGLKIDSLQTYATVHLESI